MVRKSHRPKSDEHCRLNLSRAARRETPGYNRDPCAGQMRKAHIFPADQRQLLVSYGLVNLMRWSGVGKAAGKSQKIGGSQLIISKRLGIRYAQYPRNLISI